MNGQHTVCTSPAPRLGGGAVGSWSAFTLLELLVAIVVLGVLSTLAFGMMHEARYHAREAQSVSNIRQLASANLAYAADHGRFAPDSDGNTRGFKVRWFGSRATNEMREPYTGQGGYLSEYLAGGKVRYCPVLESMFADDPTLVGGGYFEKESGGYGYNSAYVGKNPTEIIDPGGDGGTPALGARPPAQVPTDAWQSRWPGNLLANMDNASRTVMFTSSIMAQSGGKLVETAETVAYVDYEYGYPMTPTTHFRFRGRALVAWVDGHVSFEQPNSATTDWNVYRGNNDAFKIGWFGPQEYNGYWNPRREDEVLY